METILNFVSKHDTSKPKTIWKLQLLSFEIYSGLAKQYGYDPLKFGREVVRYGLCGAEGFKLKSKVIVFSTTTRKLCNKDFTVCSNTVLESIPPKIMSDLFKELIKVSKIRCK